MLFPVVVKSVSRFRFFRVACRPFCGLWVLLRNKLPCASIWAATSTCRTRAGVKVKQHFFLSFVQLFEDFKDFKG